jgi:signal transduction histidine kinase
LALAQALAHQGHEATDPDWRRSCATALIGMAFMLAAVEVGFNAGSDLFLWTVALASTGLSGFWWSSRLSGPLLRAFGTSVAAVLLIYGALLATGPVDASVLAAMAGALIITLVVGPRWLRRSRALAAERARRARSEERAEVAELVHDSVLQTLALIQSRADDPAEVKALARQQERDLRARLFHEVDPLAAPSSVASALRGAAAEVEDAHRVKIEQVTVGDAQLDDRTAAFVAAAREALFNAARHAPESHISLFAELDDTRLIAVVRDRGPGFDLEAIPADRRGVTDSIIGRMARHGGHASVRTAPGGGCEIRLLLERR